MTVTVEDLSLLERRRVEALVLVPVIRAMQARFGEAEVNEVVAGAIRGIAAEQGAGRPRVATPVELGAAIGGRKAMLGHQSTIQDGSLTIEVVAADAEQFAFDVKHCRFVEMYDELGASDLGFILSCNRDAAGFAAMAPDLTFERTQTRMQGADHCDFRFRNSHLAS